MVALPLAGTIAVYVLLAVLLLSLSITSLWRWWVKAGAIVITMAAFAGAYISISGLIGWPTTAPLPARFGFLSSKIIEPDKATGAPGHVYLWVEEVDARQLPISPPRAYELPYAELLATKVDDAQKRTSTGNRILGTSGLSGDAQGQQGAAKPPGTGEATPDNNANARTGAGTGQNIGGQLGNGTIDQADAINFSDMPPIDLPRKTDNPQQSGE